MSCPGCWRVARKRVVVHFCCPDAVRVEDARSLAERAERPLVIEAACPSAELIDDGHRVIIGAQPFCLSPLDEVLRGS